MAFIQFVDFMFLKMFGPKWKQKVLTMSGTLITEYDEYAVAVEKGTNHSWICTAQNL